MQPSNSSTYVLGIDTGGTFTDFVLWYGDTLQIHKCLSTPSAPEKAILQGIHELGLDSLTTADQFYIVHGSTVATNAILEGKGVPVVFVTNRGFADMLTIGRQTRSELYNLQPQPKPAPVAKSFCLETGGRLSADGSVIEALSENDIKRLLAQVEKLRQREKSAPLAVAINLLFSYLDPQLEIEIEEHIQKHFPGLFISRSSAILPEYKEYERGMTTWINAYVGPLVERYLQNLCSGVEIARVSVMQSSGGTVAANQAGQQAVHMVLSGPAGGLAAARYIGQRCGLTRLLTFDMGGTSTDVALIDGELELTSEGMIGPYPVAIPMVDMHTIGAGGGSIACIDAGGLLMVGPESAGADPGPACYARGGLKATVTDANLLLGRLREDAFLGGGMVLDRQASNIAIGKIADQLDLSVEQAALGIVQLANEHMAQALRVMSIQRGVDPRQLSLVSFGGAGGLHVCALADALDMRNAIVPVQAGVLSAFGMLVAPRSRQLSQTIGLELDACDENTLRTHFIRLQKAGHSALIAEGVKGSEIDTKYSVDLRYQGQAYYINVPYEINMHSGQELERLAGDSSQRAREVSKRAFHELHQQRYGHALDVEIELVNIRVAVSSAGAQLTLSTISAETISAKTNPLQRQQKSKHVALVGIEKMVEVIDRDSLVVGEEIAGPVLITEMVATTFVAPGWVMTMDEVGNIKLTRS